MDGMQLPPHQERIWSLLVQICEKRGCIIQVADPEELQKQMVSAMSGDVSDDECVSILEALAGNGGGDATGKCFEIIKQNQKKRDLPNATGEDDDDARKAAKRAPEPLPEDKKEDDEAAAYTVIFLNHNCVPRLCPEAPRTCGQVEMLTDLVHIMRVLPRDTNELHKARAIESCKHEYTCEYTGDDGVFTTRAHRIVDTLFNTPDFFADTATDEFYRPLRLIE